MARRASLVTSVGLSTRTPGHIPHHYFRPPPGPTDTAWREKFLDAFLASSGDAAEAARVAGLPSASTAYAISRDDANFARDWDEVRRIVREWRADAIEASAADRAVNGTLILRYDNKGNLKEEERVPDTQGAIFLLKGYRPEVFKERVEHQGTGAIESVTALVKALAERRETPVGVDVIDALPPERPALDAEVVSKPEPLVRTRAVN